MAENSFDWSFDSDSDNQEPVTPDEVSEEAPEPAPVEAPSAKRRRGGRPRKAEVTKAQVALVLEKYRAINTLHASQRTALEAVLDSSGDDDLVHALLDPTAGQDLATLVALKGLDQMAALVEIIDMGDESRRKLWALIGRLNGDTKTRLASTLGQAGKQLVSALDGAGDQGVLSDLLDLMN